MGALDDLLPIRRIKVDGEVQPFVRDIDFDGDDFELAVDESAGVLSIAAGAGLQRRPSNAVDIPPTSDPTGAGDQALLAAAAAAGRPTYLRPGGAYKIKDPSIFSSAANGFQLIGDADNPPTIAVVAGWTGSGADSATNAMFRFEGEATATLTTTLNVTGGLRANKNEMTLTSVTGPTSWATTVFRIQGTNNGGGDALDMSDGASVILTELVEAAGAPTGFVVPLKSPTMVHHKTGKAAQTYTPVRNIRIVGVRFDGSAATVACALRFKGCIGVVVESCRFVGFSRSAVEFDEGSRGFSVRRCIEEGGSNGFVLVTSGHDFHIEDNETTVDGARVHASGVPKACIKVKHRCAKGSISRNTLRRRTAGISLWGGTELTVDSNKIRDMYCPTAVVNRTTGTADEIQGRIGTGIDSGAGVLAYAEFAQHVTISNNVLEDCWAETETDRKSALYVHDILDVQLSNNRVTFNGVREAAKWPSGVVFSDCRGICTGLNVFGTQYAIVEENAYSTMVIVNTLLNGRTGDSSEALASLILLDNGGGASSSAVYSHLKTINRAAVQLWAFASVFIATPDYKKEVHWWHNDNDGQWSSLLLCKLKAGEATVASGELGELDSASTSTTEVLCKGLSTGSTRSVIFATGIAASGLGFVALPGDGINTVSAVATVALGDMLKAGGTRQAVVDNAPANYGHIIGRALQYRSTNGKLLMGPK